MERQEPSGTARIEESRADETSLVLLDRAQAYLRSILEERAPNTRLHESWSEFYRVYNDLIRRYVLSRQIPFNDVDDCVQEVWTAVAKHLTDFEHPRERPGLRAWLYQVVRSKTADVMRKRDKHAVTSLDALDAGAWEPAGNQDGNSVWRTLFLEAVLAEVLSEESLENRQIMSMRLAENCSSTEIAERMGLSVRVIRYRVNLVRQRVKVRLAFYSGGPLGSPEQDDGGFRS